MITKVGKNTALLMLVVLLLLISACGGGAGSSAGTNEKGAASEADAAGGAQVSDSGSGESVQGEKVVTLDSSVVYNEGEETVADTDQVSLVVTGYEMNGQDKYGEDVFTVKLRCENKTENEVVLNIKNCGVNRYVGEYYSFQGPDVIPAGETADAILAFETARLTAAGITSVDEIIGSFYSRYSDEKGASIRSDGSFVIYPSGKAPEEIVYANPITEEDVTILTDNDRFLLGFLNDGEKTAALYSKAPENSGGICLFIRCHSGEPFEIVTDKISINGKEYSFDPANMMLTIMNGLPFSDCTYTFLIGKSFMEQNQIDSVEDISEITIGLSAIRRNYKNGGTEEIYTNLVTYSTGESDGGEADMPGYAQADYSAGDYHEWETNLYTLKVTAFNPDAAMRTSFGQYKKAFQIHMNLTNLTEDTCIYLFGQEISVNDIEGFGNDDPEYLYIDAGESKNVILYIPMDELKDKGIESVDDVKFSVSCLTNSSYRDDQMLEVSPTGKITQEDYTEDVHQWVDIF